MAFGFFENSRSKGSPVELFRFRYGVFDSEAHCYTNGETPYTHLGLTYVPLPLKRTDIVSSTDNTGKSSLEVSLPGDSEVASMFRVSAPSGKIALTVFQGHFDDAENEFLAIWTGHVNSCAWDGNAATLSCSPAKSQLSRMALRRHYQYMCPHVLYGDLCRASEAAATTPVTIVSVDGRFVTVAGELTNPVAYLGGMLKYTDSKQIVHARAIRAAELVGGNTKIALSGVSEEMIPGRTVSCVRGCPHDLDGCATHSNVPNFGGMPFIPETSPLGVNGAFS